MFACVLCNGGTGEYDLAEWAFEIIRAAVKKLQKDLEAGVRTLIVGGSHLALIVSDCFSMYLNTSKLCAK